MVALMGIEPDGCQFSSVLLGPSGCVFSPVGIPGCSEAPLRTADVTAQRWAGGRATGSLATFLRKLNSAPNREFEKVASGYAVIQDLDAS
jgi:hypothetical protein